MLVRKIGFSVADLKFFNIGNLIDIMCEMFGLSEQEATQEDFDNF